MSGLFHAATTLRGNLTWAADGTVSASYVVPAHNPHFLPASLRLRWYRQWAGAYAIMPGPFTHQVLDRQEPVGAVMTRMAGAMTGPISEYPMWRRKMDATARFLEGLDKPPVQRWQLLTVTLPIPGRSSGQNAMTWATSLLSGTPPAPPSQKQTATAIKQDAALYRRLRVLIPGARRAHSGEIRWLTAYSEAFGGNEPDYTDEAFQAHILDSTTLMTLGNSTLNQVSPRPTDHIVLDAPDLATGGRQTVYQAYFIVNDFPDRWHYPNAALADDLDLLPFTVRLAAFSRPTPNQKATKQLNPLFKELDWMTSESGADHTPNVSAQQARERLDTELAELTRHKGPAFPTALVLGIGASSREELEDRARELVDALDPTHTRLHRPRGRQVETWLALHPGSPVPRIVRGLERQLHANGLAGLGLFHGTNFGDPTGRLWGIIAGGDPTGPPRLAYRNVTRGPRDVDGNRGATKVNLGDLGAGKTLDIKMDAGDAIALGGGVYVIDRSQQREWTEASRAWETEITVIDPTNPDVSIDPLRVFTSNLPDDDQQRQDALINAEKHTLGYLALVCFIGQEDDVRYDVAKQAVTDLLRDNPPLEPSLPNLLLLLRYRSGEPQGNQPSELPYRYINGMYDPRFKALTSEVHMEAAATLVGRLTNISRSGQTGKSLFGDGVPLDLRTPGVIFSAPGLKMTDRDAKATIYLAVAFSLAFLYATPRFNLLCLSEFKALADDAWGAELIDDATRQTRRSNSGLDADSQLARDIKNPELFITRTVGRTRDDGAARAAIKLIGIDDPPVELVAALTEAETGIKLARDADGNIAWIDAFRPFDADEYFYYKTDPGKQRANAV